VVSLRCSSIHHLAALLLARTPVAQPPLGRSSPFYGAVGQKKKEKRKKRKEIKKGKKESKKRETAAQSKWETGIDSSR
jgi:hypothetical protein